MKKERGYLSQYFKNMDSNIWINKSFLVGNGAEFNHTSFYLSLDFLNTTLEIKLYFFLLFFFIFVSLISLIFYLIRLNTNNKRRFLNNVEAKEV